MKGDAAPILENISNSINQIKEIAENARKTLLLVSQQEKHIHLESSLSSLDIIATIATRFLRNSPIKLDKDWLILSKGHAAPALYAILSEIGVIDRNELFKINSVNSILQNHPDISIPGVDMSTGSLGQGISFGIGVAAWIKRCGGKGRVFVILGDGEQDEGQVWEAITNAPLLKLNNLIVIVDFNECQLDGNTEDVKPKSYMPFIWRMVGWKVLWCDGHSISSIILAVEEALESDRPTVIFAKTIKENCRNNTNNGDVAKEMNKS
ncbi:MAG: 1-deoxy-D-xylulose-5-phosphate synthase N-terminal domain-containing protein [Ignisphaera sp.]|uniref:2-oxoacid oxidoreductase (ferredoxin) n=1 Tax=Ignisphaera aggregans TaxID=334771 RepID=A0A7J3MXW2_9CREN